MLPRPNESQGYRQATITTWLTRAGQHAQTLHERSFHHLLLPHLQLAELRTRLRRRQRGAVALAGDRPAHQDCSSDTRSVPAPKPWPIGSSMLSVRSWSPFCLPLFTSDGLNLSFYALTAHFGHWRHVRRGRHGQKTEGGEGVDLWPGEEKLPAAQAGSCDAR